MKLNKKPNQQNTAISAVRYNSNLKHFFSSLFSSQRSKLIDFIVFVEDFYTAQKRLVLFDEMIVYLQGYVMLGNDSVSGVI